MIRFKYIPDELVMINKSYTANFKDFVKHCAELGLANPLTEGEYLLYTPSRGVEAIDSEGMHERSDGAKNQEMETIISMVGSFCLCQENTQALEMEAFIDKLPNDQKLRFFYLKSWSVSEQLEAMQDKIDGNPTKYDKMKVDFAKIKQDIQ